MSNIANSFMISFRAARQLLEVFASQVTQVTHPEGIQAAFIACLKKRLLQSRTVKADRHTHAHTHTHSQSLTHTLVLQLPPLLLVLLFDENKHPSIAVGCRWRKNLANFGNRIWCKVTAVRFCVCEPCQAQVRGQTKAHFACTRFYRRLLGQLFLIKRQH